MGFIDKLMDAAQKLTGDAGQNQGGNVAHNIANMIKQEGMGNIVNRFKDQGLGDKISSWIGTGQNREISETEIRQGLGDEKIREIAQSSGMSEEQAASAIKEAMPRIIDHATPEGTYDPEDDGKR